MTQQEMVDALMSEAMRFHGLSQSLAASAFIAKDTDPRTERLIRDHAIRSETFKAAASLIDT